MEEQDYATTYELEDHNWWFVGTRRICLDLLDDALEGGTRRPFIVDVGCGTGLLLEHLEERGDAAGVDLSATALDFCRRRQARVLVRGDGTRLGLADGCADAITAIGVIEHLEDDRGALEEWRRCLRPGGALVLLTSAYQWMWSGHDVSNHHTRRYTARAFRRLLDDAGFSTRKLSYVNSVLFPPIAAVRAVERAKLRGAQPAPRKDTGEVPAPFNRGLVGVLELERRIIRRASLPFGVSMVASAIRR